MAIVKRNVVTKGLSGMIDDTLVFRGVDGRTIVSVKPEHSSQISEKQLQQQQVFKEGVGYAREAMADPVRKAIYEAKADRSKGQRAFNLALADFMKPPQITEIDSSAYKGAVGDILKITAIDNVQVERVLVQIYSASNSLVEEGEATKLFEGKWKYEATASSNDYASFRVSVQAWDLPGNRTEASFELNA